MSEELYTDLRLTRRGFDQLTSDRDYVDLTTALGGDIDTVSGRENLAQAITNRLLTRVGELAGLGHPNYGSKLYLLIGEPNNLRTQARADFYMRQCLEQEKRIEEITFIRFLDPGRLENRSTLRIEVGIKPIGSVDPFSISIPINL